MASFSCNSVVLLFLMRHKFQGTLSCITLIYPSSQDDRYIPYTTVSNRPPSQSVHNLFVKPIVLHFLQYRYIKCIGFYTLPVQRCVTLPSLNCRPFASEVVQAICIKKSCDLVFMKMKDIRFCLGKTISGSHLKQNNTYLVLQTRTIVLK